MEPAARDEVRPHYTGGQQALFLFVLFLTGVSANVDRNIIGVLLEPIKREFGASDTLLGLMSGSAFALFYATLGIPIARLADRGDRKLIIAVSLTIWSLLTALSGAAQNLIQLALLRVGVGAGEAGAVPPAQSLLVDYFPQDKRARAMSIYLLSSVAGLLIGQTAGGWLTQNYGWRSTFVIVGLPGLLLAMVVYALLDEPRRVASARKARLPQEPVRQTMGTLWNKAAYRNIVLAMGLYYFVAFGPLIFTPSFLIRVHHVSVATAGAMLGLISSAATVIGSLLGGWLADRLARDDPAWFARLAGWMMIASVPMFAVLYLSDNLLVAGVFIFVTAFLLSSVVPAIFAALHIVCGSARRATAVALILFFSNFFGLSFGPLATGALSDTLAAGYGSATGLRYAMLAIAIAFLPAAFFLFRAARTIRTDAEL